MMDNSAVDPESAVQVAHNGSTLTLTINRPRAGNAINSEVSTLIARTIDDADADPDVAVVVITGAGDRFFSAGADIAALKNDESVLPDPPYGNYGLAGCIERTISKPIIAAVGGMAFGGGFEIALAADIVIADPGARFAFPEVRVGIFPGAGGVHRLARRVPEVVAAHTLLTGDAIQAVDAHRFGLVSSLSEPGRCLAEAHRVAELIAQGSPLGVRYTKRLLRNLDDDGRSLNETDAWERSNALRDTILATADATEGFSAYLEKRAPRWSGA
ncbi:enoyl-CoA hydratase-related protein [Paramicrobacterium chengjingii]|uniref:enoyl-CoA hydratase-related protein n=1 Tax=Paramicrobacterium chengjingii TaxID=2769067 RepID=UPI00141E798E|nr:enoyl-CoA hydratase-related protein [Microbacterium chengjingii]